MNTLTGISFRTGLVAAAALLLAACDDGPPQPVTVTDTETPEGSSRPWDAARDRGVVFRAIGQEPGWFLDIYPEERLHLVLGYGEREVTAPDPGGEETQIGNIPVVTYRTEATETGVGTAALSIEARLMPCQDIMSGEAFDYQVVVQWGDEQFEGCGRELH